MENQQGSETQKLTDEELNQEVSFNELNPEEATSEEVEAVNKGFKTVLAQKTHWRSEALDPETGKKWKDIVKELKGREQPKQDSTPQPAERKDDDLKETVARLQLSDEKRQFGYEHKLSPEETDYAFALAKGSNKKPEEVLESDFFKSGLETTRSKAKAQSATPSPSNRSTLVEGKTFAQMSPKERAANFSKVAEAHGQK